MIKIDYFSLGIFTMLGIGIGGHDDSGNTVHCRWLQVSGDGSFKHEEQKVGDCLAGIPFGAPRRKPVEKQVPAQSRSD